MITIYLYFLLECILPLYFRTLILACTDVAYIHEGISDLRIYVTVTSPYPRDRGVTGTVQQLLGSKRGKDCQDGG